MQPSLEMLSLGGQLSERPLLASSQTSRRKIKGYARDTIEVLTNAMASIHKHSVKVATCSAVRMTAR